MTAHTLIIAEAGVNHNGSMDRARQMIDAAKEAGADMIKFQTATNCTSKYAPKAEYQKRETGEGTQLQMALKLRLTLDQHLILYRYCQQVGIPYLSSPFDGESVDFLQTLALPFWKIPSGEITDLPYLIKIAETHKPIVLSTGMAELDEVRAAVNVLKQYGGGPVTLLQCHTDYPTAFENVNLRAMQTLRREFGFPVGLSDHSRGIEVPVAAAAMGASVIEKHFTLDRRLPGPDHKASAEPEELARMIRGIRRVELALGDGIKACTDAERKNIIAARKSIVAKKDIEEGETLTEENITTRRPGNGISPMRWFEVLGTKAARHFAEDELIEQ